jgi:hypothetical protein
MSDKIDYTPIIADLERRRDEIIQSIVTLRALAGMPTSNGVASTSSTLTKPLTGSGSSELRQHQFFGMSAPDAIRSYLATVKQTRTPAKIAADLVEYGFTTTSANPGNTIRTALGRLEEDGEVVKVKKEWGLPSWFPGLRSKRKRPDDNENGEEETEAAGKKSKKPANPTQAAAGSYKAFVAEMRTAGMTLKEIGPLWQKKKAEG